MSSFKAKFPGKPVTRYVHGRRKEIKRISYRDGRQEGTMEESGPVTEYSLAATEIANNFKVFREIFGSSDESGAEFAGFDGTVAAKLKTRSEQIKGEIDSFHTQIITCGGKPWPYQRPMSSRLSQPDLKDKLTPVSTPTSMSPVEEQPSSTLTRKTRNKNRLGRSLMTRTSTRPLTPLSPLPLRLVPLQPSSFSIHTIPTVKYVQDIPFPTGSSPRSGKFVVEFEDESEDDDAENEDFATASPKTEKDGTNSPEKTLVRLNNCPMDMEDVQEYGFPVIIDRAQGGAISPKPLCFRCGSAGIEQLIYCCSCCEPYHPFCSGDESLLSAYVSRILPRHAEFGRNGADALLGQAQSQTPICKQREADSHVLSLLSPPLTPMSLGTPTDMDNMAKGKEVELKNFLRTWTCSRCYVCYICESHAPPHGQEVKFLKCPHCPRVVHPTCCAPFNGKKAANSSASATTRICEECFKCKSCGKRMDRRGGRGKEESGQVLCLDCFRQKQKGSFCPICEVCYEDDDYETKMMECARCQRWIHANCERITDEEYQILSNLPETVEYVCRQCEDSSSVFWRQAIALQFESSCEEILRIFQTKATSTWCRKPRILQPRCDNIVGQVPKVGAEVDQSPPLQPESPSTKENKGIVRTLFPGKVPGGLDPGKVQDVYVILQDCNKVSENPQGSALPAACSKKLSIVLQDCMKFPTSAHGEGAGGVAGKSNANAAISPPISELKDCKTPTKSVMPPSGPNPLESPLKRINTITESFLFKLNSQFTTVKSIYSDMLQVIQQLGEDESITGSLRLHFESALKEVFPWFSPEENDVTSLENGPGGQMTPMVTPQPSMDHPLTSMVNEEALLRWNPFEDVYWDKRVTVDMRRCSFCQEFGDSPAEGSGRLLWAGLSDWVHVNCALWSSEVWEEEDGALQQVGVALVRSRALPCVVCGKKGASVSCCFGSCRKSFHFPCALTSPCFLLEDKGMFCPDHVGKAKGLRQKEMQVLRQVYVVTDWLRKKDKSAWASDLAVFIGSCRIESLGHIVPVSVHRDDGETMLVPLSYGVSRIFWSADIPSSDPTIPEKVTYRVTTGVGGREARRSNYGHSQGQPREVNICVDHSESRDQVLRKLNQVRTFHDWAETSPTYLDEYGEEWLYPCTLHFSDTEGEESDDADVEDNDEDEGEIVPTTTIDDDLLTTSLTRNANHTQRLNSLVDDLIEFDLNNVIEEVDGDELLAIITGTMIEEKKSKLMTLEGARREAKQALIKLEYPRAEDGERKGQMSTEELDHVVDSAAETDMESDQDSSPAEGKKMEPIASSNGYQGMGEGEEHLINILSPIAENVEHEGQISSEEEDQVVDSAAETDVESDHESSLAEAEKLPVSRSDVQRMDEVLQGEEEVCDTEAETEEDEEFSKKILYADRNLRFVIPQVDGGDEDSDSYSSEDRGSSTFSSSSSSSSSDDDRSSGDGEEKERKLPMRQVRGDKAKSSTSQKKQAAKTPRETGGGRSKAMVGKKGTGVAFGGRNLRNRKKLKESKTLESKKEEFKCPVCKKSFSSQTSVSRHSKWCKPKKGQGAKEEKRRLTKEALPSAAPVAGGPKSKRGRKPKKVVNLPIDEEDAAPQRPDAEISPKPSTSGRNLADGRTLTTTGFFERDVITTLSGFDVKPDGKVYCRRCKNTYRTSLGYENHVGSCNFFSSEEEDDEAPLAEVPALSDILPSADAPAISAVVYPSDVTTESEDETSSLDSSTSSSEGTRSPPPPGKSVILEKEVMEPPPPDFLERSPEFLQPLHNDFPEDCSLVPPVTFSENDAENEVFVVQESTDENQMMEVDEEMNSYAVEENSEEVTSSSQLLETMEEEEYYEESQVLSNEYQEVTETTAAPQLIRIEIPPSEYTLPPEQIPPTVQFKNNLQPSEWLTQIQEPIGPLPDSRVMEQHHRLPLQSHMAEMAIAPPSTPQSIIHQSQHHTKSPFPSILQNQHFQTFQGVQPVQHSQQYSQQPNFHSQIHQSPSVFHQAQLQQQQQQFQTMTFQDQAGQLFTIQVPVPLQPQQQQQQPLPNSTFVQQPDPFYGQAQVQPSELQFEQYKQQVHAAIQLQRNHQDPHQPMYHHRQHPIPEQHPILVHQEYPQFHHHSPQAPPANGNAHPPMLMSVNPHLFQQSHHHHHQHYQHNSPPGGIEAAAYAHAQGQSEGMTYMLLQQGNSQTVAPVPQAQCQLTNPAPEAQRSIQAQSHHSPSLLSPQVNSANQPQQQHGLGGNFVCVSAPTARPCPCADCIRKSPSTGEKQRPYWLQKGSGNTPGGANPRKPKANNKIRDRLASMISEGQLSLDSSARLQLFKSMTSPTSTTLPKLLPATITVTSTTGTVGFKSPGIMSLQAPHPPALSLVTTLTSDSLMTPIVSASTATPQLLKAPTPSPNIAVVRPMEHPLQRISNQIQQLASSFTSPTNSVQGSLDVISGRPECSPMSVDTVGQPLTVTLPEQLSVAIPASLAESTIGNEEGMEVSCNEPERQLSPHEGETKDTLKSDIAPAQAQVQEPPPVDKSIKIQLKRQEGGDSYSINKISGSATANKQFQGMFKTLKIKGKITTGDQAGTSTDVVVHPIVHNIPIPSPDGDDGESNRTIVEGEDEQMDNLTRTSVKHLLPSTVDIGVTDDDLGPRKRTNTLRLTHRAVILYQVKIDDKIQYQSCDVRAVWGYILERVQGTRRNHNLPPLAYPATNISLPENKQEAAAAASFNRLGLTHRAVQFLLEQLPGVKNAAKEGHVFKFHEPPKSSVEDTPVVENPTGSARSEVYKGRKPFDMFGWLASKHRQPPQVLQDSGRNSDLIKGGNLPIAMKYRNLLKNGTKHLDVFWSSIHGRGLFTTRHIEAGDLIIEYAGEVIRSMVCDLREKYYESKGMGCYMFRIDDNTVVDATLKGNAARFINHSCDPNCRSRILDILGKKHILIFALGRIVAGEELTYDYKFEFEDGDKLPCTCGTKKCRKFLN